eukprot:2453182-Amphidinium_carterae.1
MYRDSQNCRDAMDVVAFNRRCKRVPATEGAQIPDRNGEAGRCNVPKRLILGNLWGYLPDQECLSE